MRQDRTRSTEIEWTEHTWNPWAGCSRKSDGCANCYAIPTARRIESFGTTDHYEGLTRADANGRLHWTGALGLASENTLKKPLAIKRPSLFFVNSMSDFWYDPELEPDHRRLPPALRRPTAQIDEWRKAALRVMRAADHHGYQVLTKRTENILPTLQRMGLAELPTCFWAGTTVESAKVLHRIDLLRQVPAAVRFLSIEPLLSDLGPLDLQGIHWVIVGGESGPGARPMRSDWVRRIQEACAAQGVPLFFKQWGVPSNNPLYREIIGAGGSPKAAAWRVKELDPVGKGGSLLDGVAYKQMPAAWTHGVARPVQGQVSLPVIG